MRRYVEKDGTQVVLFIYEVDSTLDSHSGEAGSEVRVKNQFLTEMDGVNGKGKDLMTYVIGAANKPWRPDLPFLRRFQKRIYVNLPTIEARQSLFELYTEPLKKGAKLRIPVLAKLFEGYSASDIRDVCQAAQLRVVHELFSVPEYREPVSGEEPQQPRDIAMAVFKNMMIRRKPSVSHEMLRTCCLWPGSPGAVGGSGTIRRRGTATASTLAQSRICWMCIAGQIACSVCRRLGALTRTAGEMLCWPIRATAS